MLNCQLHSMHSETHATMPAHICALQRLRQVSDRVTNALLITTVHCVRCQPIHRVQFCTSVVGYQGTSTCCKGSPNSSSSLSAVL